MIRPWRKVELSTPVIEMSPRFVSRAYPVAGGEGGGAFWACCSTGAVVVKCLLRARQRRHAEKRGRIIVEVDEQLVQLGNDKCR